MGAALLPVMLIPMVMNGIRGNATNTEMRTVACEPAHISPRLFRPQNLVGGGLKAMTQHPARIPQWLKNDLLIIAVSTAIMGSLAWIAPF